MENENKCETPRLTAFKGVLAYFSKHYIQATILMSAFALGFIVIVGCVGYAMILQAQGGCLTFFTKYVAENTTDI